MAAAGSAALRALSDSYAALTEPTSADYANYEAAAVLVDVDWRIRAGCGRRRIADAARDLGRGMDQGHGACLRRPFVTRSTSIKPAEPPIGQDSDCDHTRCGGRLPGGGR